MDVHNFSIFYLQYEDQVMKFPLAVEKAGMNRLNEFLSKKVR